MDQLMRLALQCGVTLAFLLVAVRVAGKGSMRQGTVMDLVLAFIIGELADDAVWGDVPFAQFVVAVLTLLGLRMGMGPRSAGPTTVIPMPRRDRSS